MDYLESVVLATGGAAAPAEILNEDEIIQPADQDEAEASLEKNPGDPCWDGYVQVGMKDKNGHRVPNCVPSAAAIDYVVDQINSNFGASRHVTKEAAYEVARAAADKYDYLADDELYSAVLWEVHSFSEYATAGSLDGEDFSEYSDLTPAGHPDTECSLDDATAWVAGAPDLDNSSRDAILTAFSSEADYVKSLHASTRVRAIVSSGSVSDLTLAQIKGLAARYSKVD